jgi:hypothetical protein
MTTDTDRERALVEAARKLRQAIRDTGIKRTPGLYEPVMRFDAALAQYQEPSE